MSGGAFSKFDAASARLRTLGLILRALPGEFLVNFRNGADDTARITADLDEAVAVGEAMAETAEFSPDIHRRHWRSLGSAKRYRRRFIRRHNKWFRQRSIPREHRD